MTRYSKDGWHPYSSKDGKTWPTDHDFYLVQVNTSWGGNKRIHIASFTTDGWVPRDEPPVQMFDSCVTHWHELPEPTE